MTESQTALSCPKCGAEMRGYERNGVTIDQCTGCRGIFLDRGELERLVDAESAFYDARPAAPQAPPAYGYGQGGHQGGYGGEHGSHGKGQRRRGFLGDLLG